jgi:hypothetical protein
VAISDGIVIAGGVDERACSAHGSRAELAPEVFELVYP